MSTGNQPDGPTLGSQPMILNHCLKFNLYFQAGFLRMLKDHPAEAHPLENQRKLCHQIIPGYACEDCEGV